MLIMQSAEVNLLRRKLRARNEIRGIKCSCEEKIGYLTTLLVDINTKYVSIFQEISISCNSLRIFFVCWNLKEGKIYDNEMSELAFVNCGKICFRKKLRGTALVEVPRANGKQEVHLERMLPLTSAPHIITIDNTFLRAFQASQDFRTKVYFMLSFLH